jgi:hypothetical protein
MTAVWMRVRSARSQSFARGRLFREGRGRFCFRSNSASASIRQLTLFDNGPTCGSAFTPCEEHESNPFQPLAISASVIIHKGGSGRAARTWLRRYRPGCHRSDPIVQPLTGSAKTIAGHGAGVDGHVHKLDRTSSRVAAGVSVFWIYSSVSAATTGQPPFDPASDFGRKPSDQRRATILNHPAVLPRRLRQLRQTGRC